MTRREQIKRMMVQIRRAIWELDPAQITYERAPLAAHYDVIAANISGRLCKGESLQLVAACAAHEFERKCGVECTTESIIHALAGVDIVPPPKPRKPRVYPKRPPTVQLPADYRPPSSETRLPPE